MVFAQSTASNCSRRSSLRTARRAARARQSSRTSIDRRQRVGQLDGCGAENGRHFECRNAIGLVDRLAIDGDRLSAHVDGHLLEHFHKVTCWAMS